MTLCWSDPSGVSTDALLPARFVSWLIAVCCFTQLRSRLKCTTRPCSWYSLSSCSLDAHSRVASVARAIAVRLLPPRECPLSRLRSTRRIVLVASTHNCIPVPLPSLCQTVQELPGSGGPRCEHARRPAHSREDSVRFPVCVVSCSFRLPCSFDSCGLSLSGRVVWWLACTCAIAAPLRRCARALFARACSLAAAPDSMDMLCARPHSPHSVLFTIRFALCPQSARGATRRSRTRSSARRWSTG